MMAKSGRLPRDEPRLALIGGGAIAERYYLPALARHPAVLRRLVLVDCDERRARDLAARFGLTTYYTDYGQALDCVEGAIVAVPTHLHHPITLDLVARGVPVLCEKPLAGSAALARQMVEVADSAGTCLAANYQRRLYPNLALVRSILHDGALGQVQSIAYRVGEKFDWPSVSGFYFNAALSARGVLRDRGAHVMDVICWWLGAKPELLSSQNDSLGGSETVARVRFRHGPCAGEVLVSWLCELPCGFVVECEGGTLRGSDYDYRGVTLEVDGKRPRRLRCTSGPMSYAAMAHAMVSNLLDVVRRDAPPLVAGREVLPAIEFVDDCYAAATPFDMPWYDPTEVRLGF